MDIEELRQLYYGAISMMNDRDAIINALPQPSYPNFYIIILGLIERIAEDIERCKKELEAETDEEYKELYKQELENSIFKKEICEKLLEDVKEEKEESDEFFDGKEKKLIFATRDNGGSYVAKDLKSIPKDIYGVVIDKITELSLGIVDKDKVITNNAAGTGIREKRELETGFRLYYKILGKDLAYVFLSRVKKSDNDKKDHDAFLTRGKSVKDEFLYLKKLVKDEKAKQKLINEHEIYKENLLSYLSGNQRGENANGRK